MTTCDDETFVKMNANGAFISPGLASYCRLVDAQTSAGAELLVGTCAKAGAIKLAVNKKKKTNRCIMAEKIAKFFNESKERFSN